MQSWIDSIAPVLEPPAGQPILHADADAFFASVEARDSPKLLDRPFAVVTDLLAGVIACPNCPARAYRVQGGMTIHQAASRCPNLQEILTAATVPAWSDSRAGGSSPPVSRWWSVTTTSRARPPGQR